MTKKSAPVVSKRRLSTLGLFDSGYLTCVAAMLNDYASRIDEVIIDPRDDDDLNESSELPQQVIKQLNTCVEELNKLAESIREAMNVGTDEELEDEESK